MTTYTYTAKLIRVVDGDSVILDIDIGFRTHRVGESYRLARINAPEMGTPAGAAAKLHLEALLWGLGSFTVRTTKADKYGRYLVDIDLPGGSTASDRMILDGFAVKY